LISTSLIVIAVTTLLLLLNLENIMGVVLYQLKWHVVFQIMPHGFLEFIEQSMMCLLIFLQFRATTWYMSPLSTNTTPFCLRPSRKWIWCTFLHIISQHRTLVSMVSLWSTRCTSYVLTTFSFAISCDCIVRFARWNCTYTKPDDISPPPSVASSRISISTTSFWFVTLCWVSRTWIWWSNPQINHYLCCTSWIWNINISNKISIR
jgi:hypothetical protein